MSGWLDHMLNLRKNCVKHFSQVVVPFDISTKSTRDLILRRRHQQLVFLISLKFSHSNWGHSLSSYVFFKVFIHSISENNNLCYYSLLEAISIGEDIRVLTVRV